MFDLVVIIHKFIKFMVWIALYITIFLCLISNNYTLFFFTLFVVLDKADRNYNDYMKDRIKIDETPFDIKYIKYSNNTDFCTVCLEKSKELAIVGDDSIDCRGIKICKKCAKIVNGGFK